jgi:hypothetical protein
MCLHRLPVDPAGISEPARVEPVRADTARLTKTKRIEGRCCCAIRRLLVVVGSELTRREEHEAAVLFVKAFASSAGSFFPRKGLGLSTKRIQVHQQLPGTGSQGDLAKFTRSNQALDYLNGVILKRGHILKRGQTPFKYASDNAKPCQQVQRQSPRQHITRALLGATPRGYNATANAVRFAVDQALTTVSHTAEHAVH